MIVDAKNLILCQVLFVYLNNTRDNRFVQSDQKLTSGGYKHFRQGQRLESIFYIFYTYLKKSESLYDSLEARKTENIKKLRWDDHFFSFKRSLEEVKAGLSGKCIFK